MDEPSSSTVPLAKLLPLEHKPFYSIEYPGYVQPTSVPKAIERLGGAQRVADTFRRGLKVDLKLKDNDPFAHPPNGQAVTTQNLLLKVVRRTRKKPSSGATEGEGADSPTTGASKGKFTAEVVGVVQKTLRFRSEDLSSLPLRGLTLAWRSD
jgi:general transcription factor 3C polypeptide 5 (transcription factor C subunit 1)